MLTHRLTRLISLLMGMRDYTTWELVPIVRETRYPALLRVAALRWLIQRSPLQVTHGAPYGRRRRHVRQHYQV